jgi:hypothetical protein
MNDVQHILASNEQQAQALADGLSSAAHRCSRCGLEKPRAEFYVDKTKPSGLRSYCKVCQKVCNNTPEYRAAKESQRKNSRKKDPRQYLLIAAKHRAKQLGIEFNLVLDDIYIPPFCPVFNTKLVVGDDYRNPDSPSLDRVNPDYGYTPWNIKVISFRANSIKRDASLKELESLLAFMKSYARVGEGYHKGTVVKVCI